MCFVSYHLLKQEYYSQKMKKYMHRQDDIRKGFLTEKEKKEYETAKKYFDNHEGYQLVKNIKATANIIEEGREKLLEFEEMRINVRNKMAKGELSEEDGKEKLKKIDLASNEINDLLDQMPMTGGKYDVLTQEQVQEQIKKYA